MKVVVDYYGGDFAPKVVMEGIKLALDKFDELKVIIVGKKEDVNRDIESHNLPKDRIEVCDAPKAFPMGEHASKILKEKESSIYVGNKLVKDGTGDAFVSAGNSGACMAASIFVMGRIKGIKRPGIATPIPSEKGTTVLIDSGANADCKAEYLVDFAKMGIAYSQAYFNINKPKVGLLSVGEEDEKGSQFSLEAFKLLKEKIENFHGNVEGRDLTSGKVDVIVTDGFTGNIALKTLEGVAKMFFSALKSSVKANFISLIGGALLKSSLNKTFKRFDYRSYGGAFLLGVNGISIISHGSSDKVAIYNAIRMAKLGIEGSLINKISNNYL
jgi:glycerol-3-phosphate acyltransferase PlsX